MRPAQLVAVAALRGVLLTTLIAPPAGAQNQTWIRQTGASGHDWSFSAAPDGAGGVYIGGTTHGSLGGPHAGLSDAWIARYDASGDQAWIRQLGTSGDDVAQAAVPDGAGGVYVSGITIGSLGGPNAGSWDAWLARYDGAGNQTWIRQLGTSGDDRAEAAAPDGAGGVYVSGYTSGSLNGPNLGERDAWLARYDGTGDQTWIRQFGSSDHDLLFGAASDGAGGVYLSGRTSGSLGGPNTGLDDAWLARYDGVGNRVWIRQFGTSVHDQALEAAPDGAGGVYVGGDTEGALGGPHAGSYDAWFARYDSAGNESWIRQFGTSGSDGITAAVPVEASGVFITGNTRGGPGGPNAGATDAWLARYDGVGDPEWIWQFGSNAEDFSFGAAPDGAGGVYVTGGTEGILGGPSAGGSDAWLARYANGGATSYCEPSVANSTGQPAIMSATGSFVVSDNALRLGASQLPQNSSGYFVTSTRQGYMASAGGSQGSLCLGGAIGRFVGPGQVKNAGLTGDFSLLIDLNAVPAPLFFVVVQPGETWNFQAWYRDANPGPTSNFTDAVAVTFQ